MLRFDLFIFYFYFCFCLAHFFFSLLQGTSKKGNRTSFFDAKSRLGTRKKGEHWGKKKKHTGSVRKKEHRYKDLSALAEKVFFLFLFLFLFVY